MKLKSNLKTVRITLAEANMVDQFLEQNPVIENFSSLARIAILDLISKKGHIPLKPLVVEASSQKPSFIWEYDLNEDQIYEILKGPLDQRKWLVAKILIHARFEEIWKYLSLKDIDQDLPHLRLPIKIRTFWKNACKLLKNPPQPF